MASIALYANKINCMPGFVKDVRGSVMDLKSELMTLKNKSQLINRNICNLDDVISSISTSTQIQEKKMESLHSLGEDVRQFASEVDKIDCNVADKINKNKKDFYDKYYYLKPDCEKNLLEKAWNDCKAGLKSLGEHWKLAVTVVLTIAAVGAIVVLAGVTGPVAALVVAMAKEVLFGVLIGGIVGGIASKADKRSFWEGFEDGAFGGAISGMIVGAMGGGILAVSKMRPLVKELFKGAVAEAGASLLGDMGDIAIKGEKRSAFEVMFNAVFSASVGSISSAISFGFMKCFPIKIRGITQGTGSWKHVWATQSTRSLKYGTSIRLKTIFKGISVEAIDKVWDLILEPFKSSVNEWKETQIKDIKFNKREYQI